MKKLLLLLCALLTLGGSTAWATDVVVLPSNGVYWKNGAVSDAAWAPTWKSTATASDLVTPLLIFEGETGMNTANGNIYSRQTYTLTAPSGYVIVGYTFNGTATGDDITITPAGGSGTMVTNGSNLGTPLSVDVNAQTTTFALSSSGDAHFESLALTVKVEHYVVSYSTTTGSYTAKNANGTWASRWESTATNPQVTLSVGANNIAVSTGYIYSGGSTATYTLAAQSGYVITGYEIKGTAQTAAQTLTPSAGGSAVSFGTDKEYTLSVTGLSAQSTTFTQSTPNNGIAISSFKIFLEKDPCTVTYVISDASGVIYTSDPFAATPGETITALPSSLQRSYCTYSDINETMVSGDNTINVTCTFAPPFTVSTSFAAATWYYAKIRSNKYLRADDSAKDGNGRYSTNTSNERTNAYKWAFFGNPYALYIANKGQGDGKYFNAGTNPNFVETNTPSTTTATLWEAITNGDGFNLRSLTGTNLYINDAGNGGNLGYWNSTNGRTDAGGKWVVEDAIVSDKALLNTAITSAQDLVDGAGNIGYINSTAATTLNSAIATAQSVYDDAAGDYFSAYTVLADAIATATAPANINYTPRTDVYYTIVNARGAMVYDPSHSSSVDATNGNAEYIWYGSTTPDATNVNNLWGFIEKDGNYYMYNVGKQQFASVGKGGYGATWIFSDTPAYITLDDGIADEIAAPKVRVRATIATTGNSYTMSVSTSYTGPVITYDANGDGGVPMLFTESTVAVDPDITDAMNAKLEDLTPYFTALKNAIDACAEIPLGTGVNQYTSNSTYTDALSAANTTYNNPSSTKSELQTAVSNLESAVSSLVLNLPSTGFYRIKGKTSGNYLAAGMANGKYAMSSATNATTIFYYDGTKVVNFSSGMANGMSTSSWNWVTGDAASTVVFADGGSNGGYSFKSSNAFFYDGGTNADRGSSLNSDGKYRNWYLTEITTLPVTISSAGYATLYAPVALTIPSGVKAYVAADNGEYLTLTEVETTIPANTGVILEGSEGTYDFDITTGVPAVSNALTGSVAAIARPADSYILSNGTSGVGFYKDGATTIPGFKAYLAAGGGTVKTFRFNEETAIEALESAKEASGAKIYNLAGQRVTKAKKGIYIVGGRKVVIK